MGRKADKAMPLPLLAFFGLFIPFLGTSLGAASVFLFQAKRREAPLKLLLGFASGVMIAASVWSLLIPAIEMTERVGGIPWLPATVGLLFGMAFLSAFDLLVPEGEAGRMLFFSVTLHNLPEGMAVGVAYAALLEGADGVSIASALTLSLGIALQNLPEGAVISMPMAGAGRGRPRSFGAGVLSGVVEPLGGAAMLLFTAYLYPLLPYLLAFAAGAMLYVAARELIPASQGGHGYLFGVLGLSLGFSLMMILDVAFG